VLRERQANANVTVPYKLIWHTTPKLARIQGIESYYSNGQLQFLDTWNKDYPELIEQLIHFPLAAHDDGPDALAGAVSLLLAASKARSQILIPRAR
jgi:predicted phage terminase large subunit-like protein